MRAHNLVFVPVTLLSLALAGCGTTPGDRGLSGGLLGAGAGAAIGSLAGSAGTGALLGGVGGLALGVLTSPDVINLGEPAWHHTASYHRSRSNKVASNDESCIVKETATKRVTTCTRTK